MPTGSSDSFFFIKSATQRIWARLKLNSFLPTWQCRVYALSWAGESRANSLTGYSMNQADILTKAELRAMLLDARERTLALVSDLHADQLLGPRLSIVNPPLWELGHVGWFQERWCLRRNDSGRWSPSMLPQADSLYDSATVAHDSRWDLPLLNLDETRNYLEQVLDAVLQRLEKTPHDESLDYFLQLAVFHEDMHDEALIYSRQTLGYPRPVMHGTAAVKAGCGAWPGSVYIPGGKFMLGAEPDSGFVFDNEKWAHPVEIAPYRIARAPVTNGEYANFVAECGYQRRELWSDAGWAWRVGAQANAPAYWIKDEGNWYQRAYDEIVKLPPHAPVMHVNWFEAEAYCNWAGQRLPSEAEWEMAAAENSVGKRRYPWGDQPVARRANFDAASGCVDVAGFAEGDSAHGCRQMLGNVWEWTADTFAPYPGFVADPYQEYSQPWFGTHKVLRGGCFATRARLLRNTWRNFYTPERRDVFAGFRTCEKNG